jgi:hypothetical protein
MKWENNLLTSATLLAANDCTIQVTFNNQTKKASLKKNIPYALVFGQ